MKVTFKRRQFSVSVGEPMKVRGYTATLWGEDGGYMCCLESRGLEFDGPHRQRPQAAINAAISALGDAARGFR